MDLADLLQGTESEGSSVDELLVWARSRTAALIAEIDVRSEFGRAFAESLEFVRAQAGSSAAGGMVNLRAVDMIDEEPEIEILGEGDSPIPPPPTTFGTYEHGHETVDLALAVDEGGAARTASGSFSPGAPGLSESERASIGFAIDDALSAALTEGISPDESWKLPMELQDISGFKQVGPAAEAHTTIGRPPEAGFESSAGDPGSSGSFESGIPDLETFEEGIEDSGRFARFEIADDDELRFDGGSAAEEGEDPGELPPPSATVFELPRDDDELPAALDHATIYADDDELPAPAIEPGAPMFTDDDEHLPPPEFGLEPATIEGDGGLSSEPVDGEAGAVGETAAANPASAGLGIEAVYADDDDGPAPANALHDDGFAPGPAGASPDDDEEMPAPGPAAAVYDDEDEEMPAPGPAAAVYDDDEELPAPGPADSVYDDEDEELPAPGPAGSVYDDEDEELPAPGPAGSVYDDDDGSAPADALREEDAPVFRRATEPGGAGPSDAGAHTDQATPSFTEDEHPGLSPVEDDDPSSGLLSSLAEIDDDEPGERSGVERVANLAFLHDDDDE